MPVFAPVAFNEAVVSFTTAVDASGDDPERRAAAIAAASEALAVAERRAEVGADVLADLPRLRSAALRDERERYHAPATLVEAEVHVARAIDAAEDGNSSAARKHADAARRAFAEASLAALEHGTIDTLEAAVREAADRSPASAQDEMHAELDRLRRGLDATRRGEQDVSQLRRSIAIGARRIGSGLRDLGVRSPIGPWDPIGPIGPIGPKPPDGPTRVDDIRVVRRRDRSLELIWWNPPSTATRNVLVRQRESGPWEEVADFGPLQGWTRHTDARLDPDTLYCYRIRSENDQGIVMTPINQRAGGYTRATTPIGVWRAQLRIRIADIEDADTSDPIRVRLTSPLDNFNPHGNERWLDYGPRWENVGAFGIWRDDFARGREFTYDLDQQSVGALADITMLIIEKVGSDAVGIAEIALLVDEVEVFSRHFGETASTCLWLDDGDGHEPRYTVWHGELRAHPSWQAIVASPPPPPRKIANADLVSRIEGLIGHAIHGTQAYWGEYHSPGWVEATKIDDSRLRVDVDLEADVTLMRDPEIDIDFELEFRIICQPGAKTATLRIAADNLHANVDFDIVTELFGYVLTLGQFGSIEDYIARRIEEEFTPIVESIPLDTLNGFCPSLTVENNHSITFSLGP
ncbi:MAG TPA: fibronectin type III domain-containing protein [Agromyces sp.]